MLYLLYSERLGIDSMLIKVAALQTAVTDSTLRNIRNAVSMIMRAGREEPDLICLPEAWLHSNPLQVANKLMQSADKVVKLLSRYAEELGVMLIGGGLYVPRDSRPRISTPVIGPNGEVMGWQDKIHLFRSEKRIFTHGDRLEVFGLKGYKIGVLICHDIVYPELARILTLKGADLLVNPSRIPSIGVSPWHTYIEARSLENRVAVAAPNIWMPPSHGGGTNITNLSKARDEIYHAWRTTASDGPGMVIQEMNLSALWETRKERLSNRLPAIYERLERELLFKPPEAIGGLGEDMIG